MYDDDMQNLDRPFTPEEQLEFDRIKQQYPAGTKFYEYHYGNIEVYELTVVRYQEYMNCFGEAELYFVYRDSRHDKFDSMNFKMVDFLVFKTKEEALNCIINLETEPSQFTPKWMPQISKAKIEMEKIRSGEVAAVGDFI